MYELSNEGNVVIVGRAGQVILQDAPGFIHVRVIAPKELRVRRVMEEKSQTSEVALAMVEKSDLSRSQYLRRNYHAEVDDPSFYDLVINTHRIDPVLASKIICDALQQRIQA
jgi:cytidylate kinase